MPEPTPGVDFAFTTWEVTDMMRDLPDGDTPPEGQVICLYWKATHYASGLSAWEQGNAGLGAPDPDNYTPFEDITEEQADEWLKASLGDEEIATIEARLAAQIQEQLAPKMSLGLPNW